MLSKFPNKTLKVGAKVSLSPQSRYRNGEGGGLDINPVGVVGVVESKEDFYLLVVWENSHIRVDYNSNDYDLIAEGEPGYLETYF